MQRRFTASGGAGDLECPFNDASTGIQALLSRHRCDPALSELYGLQRQQQNRNPH